MLVGLWQEYGRGYRLVFIVSLAFYGHVCKPPLSYNCALVYRRRITGQYLHRHSKMKTLTIPVGLRVSTALALTNAFF